MAATGIRHGTPSRVILSEANEAMSGRGSFASLRMTPLNCLALSILLLFPGPLGLTYLAGARGKGWVYQQRRLIGRSTLTQVSIGFQFGGQAYSEVVFFKDKAALDNFKLGHLKLDAQASAIALTARASADLAYRNGVAIVTMAKGGLMYEASVGGQKFSFKPLAKGT